MASLVSARFAVEPGFWDAFVATYHGRRPGAWRRPFATPIARPDEAFSWLLAARDEGLRVFAGADALDPLPGALRPAPEDGGCAAYLRRLRAALGDAGAMANHLQALDAGLYNRLRAFLAGLYARAGAPSGGALLDLFLGAYRKSFLGLHKDEQDVFTFVVEGHKTFLVWPYEVFADHPDVAPGSEAAPVMLGDADYESERARATVLEGDAGDVFYWPSDHWHVAESDGAPCVTLSLGLFPGGDPVRFLTEAARALCDDGAMPAPPVVAHTSGASGDARALLDARAREVEALLRHPVLRARMDAQCLGWLTSYGFRHLPAARPREDLADDAAVRATVPGAVAWFDDGAGGLVWSVSGQLFRRAPDPGLTALFNEVNTGNAATVGALVARATAAGLDATAARAVLATLWRHHGIERC